MLTRVAAPTLAISRDGASPHTTASGEGGPKAHLVGAAPRVDPLRAPSRAWCERTAKTRQIIQTADDLLSAPDRTSPEPARGTADDREETTA